MNLIIREPVGSAEPSLGRHMVSGLVRLAFLCALIVAVGMQSPRLEPDVEIHLLLLGVGVTLAAFAIIVVLNFVASRRHAARIPVVGGLTVRALILARNNLGLPIIGLAFFLVWAFIYIGVWLYNPQGSFAGLSDEPRFADFFYYAVSTAFISPPGDITAISRGARSATMIEMLTGFAVLAAYLSSFVDRREVDKNAAKTGRTPPAPD